MKTRGVVKAYALVLLGALAGCSGDADIIPRCTPGVSAACTCSTGRSGAQICGTNGVFGTCSCTAAADAGVDSGRPRDDAGTAADALVATDVTTTADVPPVDVGGDIGATVADVVAPDVPSCPSGLTACGAACLNTMTDSSHCGSCGNACAASTSCVAGSCSGGPRGERIFEVSGTFVVPAGVTSVSVVVVGAGGSATRNSAPIGGGGGLCYRNDIVVVPGASIPVAVGLPPNFDEGIGGNSGFNGMVTALGGRPGVGGGGGGGTCFSGGAGQRYGGGGGAAGYAGNGGNGGTHQSASCTNDATASSGGGGGGGGGSGGGSSFGAGGGGVGLFGRGANGAPGTTSCAAIPATAGGGGSGGAAGGVAENVAGGDYGGGGNSGGGHGAVRIIWGPGRSFPDNAM